MSHGFEIHTVIWSSLDSMICDPSHIVVSSRLGSTVAMTIPCYYGCPYTHKYGHGAQPYKGQHVTNFLDSLETHATTSIPLNQYVLLLPLPCLHLVF
jgi:hypothetical protein